MYSDVVELISVTTSQNEIGSVIETPSYREVFANRKGVKRAEFYQAQALGMRVELVVEIHAADYQDEQRLRYYGREYDIIRTYQPGPDKLEIVCKGAMVNG